MLRSVNEIKELMQWFVCVLKSLQSVMCWHYPRVRLLSNCSILCSPNTAFIWSVQIFPHYFWKSFAKTVAIN